MPRESFNSRIGFILVSAGCAIGIGNVWRFPFVAGENGGGLFVLLYLLFLLIMGLPVLTMELAVGRSTRKSAVSAYRMLKPGNSIWQLHGWAALAGCIILMLYYTTVSGWMLSYFVKFLTGEFIPGMSVSQVGDVFGSLLSDPVYMGFWTVLTVVLGFFVCSFGLQKGLERVTKFMMAALLGLIVILAVHSLTLERAAEGMRFFLLPDFEAVSAIGLGNVITAAMNQAFFTLSLGIAAMEIFGSYMDKSQALTGEAVRICILDTFVAVMAGIIIFPACFSFGLQPDAGPSLIFVTLPNVFVNMSGGQLWGTLFFLFMTFASLSTVLAVFENIIALFIDTFGWSRKKAVFFNGALILLGSLPCVLGFNEWSDVTLIGGRGILDSEDFIVSNILLPGGSLVYLLFCVTRWGWGFDNYLAEVNTGSGMKLSRKLKPYLQLVLPLLLFFIFARGLI
ncbi:MAG: sodium-dependent transporter [Anaerovibrio sp.]|nr:sodium-dependent transporter [Anaerovibrio sp.]